MNTLHDRLVAALTALGATPHVSRSSKYTALRTPHGFRFDRVTLGYVPSEAGPHFFWVGRAGALRLGPTASASISATNRFRNWLLEQQR
jgi:hypothetical protein